MMRITLNIILRAVFGADGVELQRLRDLIPTWVTLGSRLAVLPAPNRELPWTPWAKLTDYRREYEGLVDTLIDRGPAGPELRGPHRRAVAVPAQHLRGRLDDDAR